MEAGLYGLLRLQRAKEAEEAGTRALQFAFLAGESLGAAQRRVPRGPVSMPKDGPGKVPRGFVVPNLSAPASPRRPLALE